MNPWIDRIKNHPVWVAINRTEGIIKNDAIRASISPQSLYGLERLRSVVAYTKERLLNSDPELINYAALDAIRDSIDCVGNELQAYALNGNEGHISNANNLFETTFSTIASLPVQLQPSIESVVKVQESAQSYRRSVEKLFDETENLSRKTLADSASVIDKLKEIEADQLRIKEGAFSAGSKLTEFSVEIEEKRKSLLAISEEQRAAFSAMQTEMASAFSRSENNRIAAFAANAEEQQRTFLSAEGERKANANQLAVTHQEQHASSQAARQSEFTENSVENQKRFTDAQAERQESFISLVASYHKSLSDQEIESVKNQENLQKHSSERLETLNSEYSSEAKKILDQVSQHNDDVEKLVGVIGNTGVTSGYLNTANIAEKSKGNWQKITVVALLVLSGEAMYAFQSGGATWESLASRVLTALPVIVLAAYAGSQADKCHQNEKRNRKLALELAAIGPYLAPLPTDLQNKFRVDIGERSFGRHDDGVVASEKSPATLIDLLGEISKSEKLMDSIKSFIKPLRGS